MSRSLASQLLPTESIVPQRAFARAPRRLNKDGKLVALGPYLACVASADAAARYPSHWANAVLQHGSNSNQMLAIAIYAMDDKEVLQQDILRPAFLYTLTETFRPVALVQYEAVELHSTDGERNVVVSDVYSSSWAELLKPEAPLMWIPFLACVRAQAAKAVESDPTLSAITENAKYTWTLTRTVRLDGISDRLAAYQGFRTIEEIYGGFWLASVMRGSLPDFVDMVNVNEGKQPPLSTLSAAQRKYMDDFQFPNDAARYDGLTIEFLTKAKLEEALAVRWRPSVDGDSNQTIHAAMRRSVGLSYYSEFRSAILLFRIGRRLVGYVDISVRLESTYTLYSFALAADHPSTGQEELRLLLKLFRQLASKRKSLWASYLRPGVDEDAAAGIQQYGEPPRFVQAVIETANAPSRRAFELEGFINATADPQSAASAGLARDVPNAFIELVGDDVERYQIYFLSIDPDVPETPAVRSVPAAERRGRMAFRDELLLSATRCNLSADQRSELGRIIASQWPGMRIGEAV